MYVYVFHICVVLCLVGCKMNMFLSVSMRAKKLLQARALGGRQCIPLKSRIFRVSYGQALGLDQLPDTINLLHSS